ncbi:MAG: hypothetical protein ACQERB_15330 [Promethearchaeati archaeon]
MKLFGPKFNFLEGENSLLEGCCCGCGPTQGETAQDSGSFGGSCGCACSGGPNETIFENARDIAP